MPELQQSDVRGSLILIHNCLWLVAAQTRDAILKGAHPISMEYAVQFAGMQCQIQFSDHVETKHKPGFIEYEPQPLIITNNNNNSNAV